MNFGTDERTSEIVLIDSDHLRKKRGKFVFCENLNMETPVD